MLSRSTLRQCPQVFTVIAFAKRTGMLGELLVVECAGAYGFVMSSNYNSKPQPAEVLIVNGKAHLARARQTPEDRLTNEARCAGDEQLHLANRRRSGTATRWR